MNEHLPPRQWLYGAPLSDPPPEPLTAEQRQHDLVLLMSYIPAGGEAHAALGRPADATLDAARARPGLDVERLAAGIAYAIAHSPLPGKNETASEYAARLAPLVIDSEWLTTQTETALAALRAALGPTAAGEGR